MRSCLVALVALLALGSPAAGQTSPAADGRAFEPEDWYRLTTLSSPAVSPDGLWVAFTVTTVREEENERHSEIWMVSADGGEPWRLQRTDRPAPGSV